MKCNVHRTWTFFSPHFFRPVHSQRFSHTIHAFSDEYLHIYLYIRQERKKKLTISVSGLSVRQRVLLDYSRWYRFLRRSDNSAAEVFSLDVVQNHAERTNSKIYAIFFSSTKGQNKGGISESRRLRDPNIMFTFFFDFVSITNFSRFI